MCRSFSRSVAAITRPTSGAADSTLPHTCRYTGVDIVRRAQPWLSQPPAKGERESRGVLRDLALPLTVPGHRLLPIPHQAIWGTQLTAAGQTGQESGYPEPETGGTLAWGGGTRCVSEAFERDGFVVMPGFLAASDLARALGALLIEFPTAHELTTLPYSPWYETTSQRPPTACASVQVHSEVVGQDPIEFGNGVGSGLVALSDGLDDQRHRRLGDIDQGLGDQPRAPGRQVAGATACFWLGGCLLLPRRIPS
jgi:hypothetical protein